MDNKNLFYLKEFKFINFFDYLALELDIVNNYKFSDYCRLLEFISNVNKYKNNIIKINSIRTTNNFKNKYDLLDLVYNNYNNDAKIKLFYSERDLLVEVNNGEFYYNIFIKINFFKNYKDIFNFICELEEYVETTN